MSDNSPTIFCTNHPQTEASLRCNRCEKPICVRCAVLTPTGYRCRECVRGQQKVFETARWYDHISAIALAGILSYLGSRLVPAMGFFTIFVAPIAGVIIAELIRLVVQRRRSKRLFQAVAVAAALGSILMFLPFLLALISGGGGFGILWRLLWQGFYTVTVTSSVYYRLGGIQIR